MMTITAADRSCFGFRTACVVEMGRSVHACRFRGSAANETIYFIDLQLEGGGAAGSMMLLDEHSASLLLSSCWILFLPSIDTSH
jgi:hypothetical protein